MKYISKIAVIMFAIMSISLQAWGGIEDRFSDVNLTKQHAIEFPGRTTNPEGNPTADKLWVYAKYDTLFMERDTGEVVPVWGGEQQYGAVTYYVDKAVTISGDGLSRTGAYKTIAEAITAVNARIDWSTSPWAKGDIIRIACGSYAENLTSLPYGGTIIGDGDAWDADGENGVRIKPASGSPVDVNACINSKIVNINFEAANASRVFDSAILNNVQIEHCRFAGPPEATTALAGIYTNDSVMLTVRDSRFEYLDCGIDAVYADGGDSFTRAHIENNYFTFISEAGVRVSASLVAPASMIVGNIICQGGQTLTIGIDINITNTIGIYNNRISATDGIEGDTTGVYVGGNYCNGVLE